MTSPKTSDRCLIQRCQATPTYRVTVGDLVGLACERHHFAAAIKLQKRIVDHRHVEMSIELLPPVRDDRPSRLTAMQPVPAPATSAAYQRGGVVSLSPPPTVPGLNAQDRLELEALGIKGEAPPDSWVYRDQAVVFIFDDPSDETSDEPQQD